MSNPVNRSTILLIDDSLIDGKMTGLILERAGFNYQWLSTGEEALDFLSEKYETVDLILMDMELGSGIDGAETAKQILEKYNIPILFLSSYTDDETLKKIEDITSYGYIIKGSPPSVITASIQMAFRLKKVKAELADSHRIFNHALDMLGIIGFDGYFKVLNPSWSRVLGWSVEELLARPWISFVHEEDRESALLIESRIIKGEQIYNYKIRYTCSDGNLKWISWSIFPYGEEKVMFSAARDVTCEIKCNEEKEFYQKELFEAEKMKAIGQLSAGVAHEFNNILAIIKVKLQMLPFDFQGEAAEKIAESAAEIEKVVARGADIVKDLMNVSKPSKEEKKKVLPESIIDTVLNVLTNDLKNSAVNVVRNYNSDSYIFVDPGHLYQVFLNIIINALHAVSDVKSPMIEIDIYDEDKKVIIDVKDNGHGIQAGDMSKVFLPFFTTKGASAKSGNIAKGSGLGLFVCRDLVVKNEGTISAVSEYQTGSCFTVKFNVFKENEDD